MTPPLSSQTPKTCLVTGATGFMGSHMVEQLAQAGHRVRATDLPGDSKTDDPMRGRFPGFVRSLSAEFVPADLSRSDQLRDLARGADWVFHIAGLFDYSAPRAALYRVNVEGTRNLAEALVREASCQRLVLWGAGGIYGTPSRDELPLREDSPIRPPNAYLQSKWDQECLVRQYFEREGLPYTCLRPTGVYGPRSIYGMGRLLIQMAGMKAIKIPKNFTGRMPLVHAADVCRSALHLAGTPSASGEAFHLADDVPYSNVDFFRMVADLLGKPFRALPPFPAGLLRSAASFLAIFENFYAKKIAHRRPQMERDTLFMLGADFWYSNEKLKNSGYRFQYPDSRQGIKETLQWYTDHGLIKKSP